VNRSLFSPNIHRAKSMSLQMDLLILQYQRSLPEAGRGAAAGAKVLEATYSERDGARIALTCFCRPLYDGSATLPK